MMEGIKIELKNGLTVGIDWISFTVFELHKLEAVVKFLGYDMTDFTAMPKGGKGYKSMIKLNGYPIYVLYDGKEDMGIHVTISGSAISEAVKAFKTTIVENTPFGIGYEIGFDSTFLLNYLEAIRTIGRVGRIDLAVDDIGGNYFSLDRMVSIMEEKKNVSKFKSWKNLCESERTGEKTGHTIYLGSRTSDIFLRVYDKKLEQNKKLSANGENLLKTEWIRWELELKNERAQECINMLLQKKELGSVCVGILSNYFRVVKLDHANKSRCTIDRVWKRFVGDVEKLSLYIPSFPKTLEEKRKWFEVQVAPTLAGIILADGGMLDIVTQNFDQYVSRMSKAMIELVIRANPDMKHYF